MKIYIIGGKGTGLTTLSAFDAALKDAGVYNYNLINLSSIIPPNSKIIIRRKYKSKSGDYGNKLYLVKADIRSQQAGKFISAGIGWYQFGDNRGLLVEHGEIAETKIAIESEINLKIQNSLKDLCRSRHVRFEEKRVGKKIITTQIKELPACVLVSAIFKVESWQ